MIQRPRVQVVHMDNVAAGATDVEQSPIIPDGDSWHISKIIFADDGIGDNLAGGFLVDYGDGGGREVLAAAYLSSNTFEYTVKRTFVGDGSKRFRFIRINKSALAKKMFLLVEGFQRNQS